VEVGAKDVREFRRSAAQDMFLRTFGVPWWFVVVALALGVIYFFIGK
jgi:hypothetical protein